MRSLRELGITVPSADRLPAELDRQFDYLYRWLERTGSGDEPTGQDITDPRLLAATHVINTIVPANYFVADQAMLAWLSLQALRIGLEHGSARALLGPMMQLAFPAIALRGDYVAGYRAVRRIVALGESRGYEPDASQARFLFAYVSCWFEPIENGVQAAQRAREGLIAGADLANAGYTYVPVAQHLMDSAATLDGCAAEVETGLAFVRRSGSEQTAQWLDSYRWLADVLRGESSEAAGEAAPDKYAGNPMALFHAYVNHATAAAIFGDAAGLVRHTAAAMTLLPVVPGIYPTAVAHMLRGLALAGQARDGHGGERGGLLSELEEVTRWLAARAVDAPDNFLHLLRLVEAERAWVDGDFHAAAIAFDAARREVAQLDWAYPSLRPQPDAPAGQRGINGREDDVPMSVLRYTQRTGQPLVVSDATRDDRFARDPYFSGLTCCSLLAVPVLGRGTLRAVLLLENRLIRGAFTTERLDAVKLIAGQLAVSLDNAHLYAEFRRIADEQAALRRVATLVARGVGPDPVFAAVDEEVATLIGTDNTAIVRFEPDGEATVMGGYAALNSPSGSRGTLDAHSAMASVQATGYAARRDADDLDETTDEGPGFAVAGPIVVEGRVWGAIGVGSRRERLPQDTEQRLADFTELVATAIANAEPQAATNSPCRVPGSSPPRPNAPPDRTRPPRRSPATTRHTRATPADGTSGGTTRTQRTHHPPRRTRHRNDRRTRRTPRNRPRHPPRDPGQERPRRGAAHARPPLADPGRPRCTRGRAAAPACRGQHVLRRRRGTDQRGQARARRGRHRHRRHHRRHPSRRGPRRRRRRRRLRPRHRPDRPQRPRGSAGRTDPPRQPTRSGNHPARRTPAHAHERRRHIGGNPGTPPVNHKAHSPGTVGTTCSSRRGRSRGGTLTW